MNISRLAENVFVSSCLSFIGGNFLCKKFPNPETIYDIAQCSSQRSSFNAIVESLGRCVSAVDQINATRTISSRIRGQINGQPRYIVRGPDSV